MKDTAYSAISRREAQKNSQLDYIFPSKKKARAELERLAAIIEKVVLLLKFLLSLLYTDIFFIKPHNNDIIMLMFFV